MPQKKKIVLIAVIVVIVIAAAVAVFAISGRKDDGNNSAAENANNDKNQQNAALLGPSFTDPQTGVSVHAPKDWQLAPRNNDNPNSLTKFQHTQSRANGELTTIKSKAKMDDVVRGYLEGAINIDFKTELVKHETIVVGGKSARLVIQDIPGPDGQTARIVQYFFSKDGTYYILSYTVLGSDWEALKPGIEASAASLEMK